MDAITFPPAPVNEPNLTYAAPATQDLMGSFGVSPMTLVRGFQIEGLFQEVQPEPHSPILAQQCDVTPGAVFDHLGQQRELHADHSSFNGQGLDGGGQEVVLAGGQQMFVAGQLTKGGT